MKANELDEGRRKKKRKVKSALYGPGPYGTYGTDAGYSGDGGVGESRKFTDVELAIMEGGGSIESNDVYYLKQSLQKRLYERYEGKQPQLPDVLADFLPVAMKILDLKVLPKIEIEKQVEDRDQPTFGRFVNHRNIIHLGVKNRHPLDILRTLAHELVHFKQKIDNRLNAQSGETGSPEENEAHIVAGIIMRNFNKRFPHYFNLSALT